MRATQHLNNLPFARERCRRRQWQRGGVAEDRLDDGAMGRGDRLRRCRRARQRAHHRDELVVVDEVDSGVVDAANAPEVDRVERSGDRVDVGGALARGSSHSGCSTHAARRIVRGAETGVEWPIGRKKVLYTSW